MKRLSLWLGLGLLLSILLVGGIVFASSSVNASTFSGPPHHPLAPTSFRVNDSYVPGNPAISPHVSTANTANNASIPAFSKKDVADFLNVHGFYAGPVVNGGHLKIVSIQFVTAKQAGQLIHGESIGRPDNYLVCYVKVQGPFSGTYVYAGPPNIHRKGIPTFQFGDVVFDAHTGNMLLWGVN